MLDRVADSSVYSFLDNQKCDWGPSGLPFYGVVMQCDLALLIEIIDHKAAVDDTDSLVAALAMLDSLDEHRIKLTHIIDRMCVNESETHH